MVNRATSASWLRERAGTVWATTGARPSADALAEGLARIPAMGRARVGTAANRSRVIGEPRGDRGRPHSTRPQQRTPRHLKIDANPIARRIREVRRTRRIEMVRAVRPGLVSRLVGLGLMRQVGLVVRPGRAGQVDRAAHAIVAVRLGSAVPAGVVSRLIRVGRLGWEAQRRPLCRFRSMRFRRKARQPRVRSGSRSRPSPLMDQRRPRLPTEVVVQRRRPSFRLGRRLHCLRRSFVARPNRRAVMASCPPGLRPTPQ